MSLSPASRPKARLSDRTLAEARPEVRRPGYDRSGMRIGVAHFGPGAFHRAHQAFYFDRMLQGDPGFAVSAISLHSDSVRAALGPQDGLYSLTEREAEPSLRVIGSIGEVLTAPRSPAAVLARLTDPELRLVTATVTEKGYALDPRGDLDLDHPQVRHDIEAGGPPETLAGWLVEGLRRRRAAGLGGLRVLSCDNLSGNGRRLGRSVVQLAEARGDTDLASWIAGEAVFPDTMVDSITPATDDLLRAEAAERLGLADAWPIQRERFTQWVVADELGPLAETFAAAGVILTDDVAGFERAKLRLLNGAHSTLAYVGLGLGYESVFDAMGDPVLAGFVERMAREDMAASLSPTRGLETEAYVGQVLGRFRNPAIVHRLIQIAADGSQKLPIRLLAPIREALAAGRPIARMVVGVAAWMQFVRRQTAAGAAIADPLAPALEAIARRCTGGPVDDVAAFLELGSVFDPELAQRPELRAALEAAYGQLGSGHADLALRI